MILGENVNFYKIELLILVGTAIATSASQLRGRPDC